MDPAPALQNHDLHVTAALQPVSRHLLLRGQEPRNAARVDVPALPSLALRDRIGKLPVPRRRCLEHSPPRCLLDPAGNRGTDRRRRLPRKLRHVDRRGHLHALLDTVQPPRAVGQVHARPHVRLFVHEPPIRLDHRVRHRLLDLRLAQCDVRSHVPECRQRIGLLRARHQMSTTMRAAITSSSGAGSTRDRCLSLVSISAVPPPAARIMCSGDSPELCRLRT